MTASLKETLQKTPIEVIAQAVQPLDVDNKRMFLVPVGDSPDGALRALLVFPQRRATATTIVFAQILSLLGAIGFLWFAGWGFSAKQKENARRSDLVIFRSLQIGVTETSLEANAILRANDRAEELLGKELPKELLVGESKSEKFHDLYDLALEIEGDTWPDMQDNPLTDIKCKYKEMTAADLLQRRRQGKTTRYWIHVLSKPEDRSWLLVQAGPIFRQKGLAIDRFMTHFAESSSNRLHSRFLGTFGTLEPASVHRLKGLSDAREECRKKKPKSEKGDQETVTEAGGGGA